MSGIYGFIQLKGNNANHKELDCMGQIYETFPYDDHKQVVHKNIAFGCLKQNITLESVHEEIPYYDENEQICIVADAIIDNRKELINSFQQLNNESSDILFILEAYKRWGTECCKHLVGDYVFVIYDFKRHEIFVARDHVGKKTLYYCIENNMLIFSSLLNPLKKLLSFNKNRINKKWLSEFLAIPTISHECTENETIYKGIYHVKPAHYITWTQHEFQEVKYWDPLKVRKRKYKNYYQLVDEFNQIYNEAVVCRLRAKDHVGVMLSGGLDSSSIACLAAKELTKGNKTIHAYTSVPLEDCPKLKNKRVIADERDYVYDMAKMYNNIDVHLISSRESNSYNVVPNLIDNLEQPYKFIENSYWIENITRSASLDQCNVLLDGTYGNVTISFGNIQQHVYTRLKNFKWVSAYKSIKDYCKLYTMPRKKYLLYYLQLLKKNFLYFKDNLYSTPIVREEIVKKYQIEKSLTEKGFTKKPLSSIHKTKQIKLHASILNHLASIENKLGLKYNLVKRDPTRDKRVIEFLMSIPDDSFVQNGVPRALIKQAMIGIVPESIITNHDKRGRQGIDWLVRIEPYWETIVKEINEYYAQSNLLQSIIDEQELFELIERNRYINDYIDPKYEYRQIMIIFVTIQYMKVFSGYAY